MPRTMDSVVTLSVPQARRIAIAAQQLDRGRDPAQHDQGSAQPAAESVTTARISALLRRLQLLQIDSVSVLCRSHYLPVFSRLGPYDRSLLDRMSSRAPRQLMEYWAHEASFIRPELYADLLVTQRRRWAGLDGARSAEADELAERIVDLLARSRPMKATRLAEVLDPDHVRDTSHWGWNWSRTKRVLEDLLQRGVVAPADRTAQFERLYTLTGNVLPPRLREQTLRQKIESNYDDAVGRLTRLAIQALGVASAKTVADYFRLPVRATTMALQELQSAGAVRAVQVAGISTPYWLDARARRPRRVEAAALLSPFDSMVFERSRLEELFGFRYRIGIYTPAAQREHGYYVLPFLLEEAFAARVDLKADRARGVLVVKQVHFEPDAPSHAGAALEEQTSTMAGWLELDSVEWVEK